MVKGRLQTLFSFFLVIRSTHSPSLRCSQERFLEFREETQGKMLYACYNIFKRGNTMDYSALLKNLRETLLITQTELADMLNVSFATVNRWENKRTEPTLKARRKIRELCQENNIELEKFKYE